MQISVAQFEKQGLALLSQLEATHEEIVIIREGKPIAKLVSFDDPPVSCLDLMHDELGCLEDGPEDSSSNPDYLKDYGS